MSTTRKETVLRTTALFSEGDRPEYKASDRTTMVITRAVLEDVIGNVSSATLSVYGYRKEKPPAWPAHDQPGQEPKWATYSLRSLPLDLHPLFRRLNETRPEQESW